MEFKDNDLIHKPVADSIYVRTDYIVNSDMSIPFALAHTWLYGIATEGGRRTGFPPVDRRPINTPIVLYRPTLPIRK